MKGPFFGLFLLVSLASSGKICTWNTQSTDCVGNAYTGTCIDERCECSVGYKPQGEMCIALGKPCTPSTANPDCAADGMTGQCVNERCQCSNGYIADGDTCKSVGRYCHMEDHYYDVDYYEYYDYDACNGRGYTKWCVENRCRCSDGYQHQVESCEKPYPPIITINGTTMADNSQYNIDLGDKVVISCKHDNGFTLLLHVGISFYTENEGIIVSAVHVGDQFQPKTTITCRDLTVFLITTHGPSSMEVGPQGFETSALCSLGSVNVSMYVDFNKTDVYPPPNVTIRGFSGVVLEADAIDEMVDVYRYRFFLTPASKGKHPLVVEARNPAFPELSTMTNVTLEAYEPPIATPSVSINGTELTNGSIYNVKLGDSLVISCSVEGGTPSVESVTLMGSNGVMSTTNGASTTTTLSVSKSLHNTQVVCSANHPSLCYHSITVFTISVAYGPSSMEVGPRGVETSALCSLGSVNVSMYVDFNKTDVYPPPNVTIRGFSGVVLEADAVDEMVDVYRYRFFLTPASKGKHPLVVEARNPAFPELSTMTNVTLEAYDPPLRSPLIITNTADPVTNNSVEDVKLGQSLNVQCSVEGGVPLVETVTLDCGQGAGLSNTTDGTSTSLSLTVSNSLHLAQCQCRAHHISLCYQQTSVFTINVARGPTSAIATFEDVNRCPGGVVSNVRVHLQLKVSKADFNTRPTAFLKDMASEDLDPVDIEDIGDALIYKFVYPTVRRGRVKGTLVAFNPVFGAFKVEKPVALHVNEPPVDGPVVVINTKPLSAKDGVATVNLGETLEISCRVEGGTPVVSQVELACGGTRNISSSVESSITVVVEKTTHGTLCECSATHIAGCYDKKEQFSLGVWYPATMQGFTVNSKSDELTVKEGTRVSLFCMAEGIPAPNLTIIGVDTSNRLPGETTTVNYYTSKLQFDRTMTTKDSDTYVCKADNGESSQANVSVKVLGQPGKVTEEIPEPPIVEPTGVFSISFFIYSRPSPTRYLLMKPISTNGRRKRASFEIKMPESNFIATFEQVNENRGRIDLAVYDRDFGEKNSYRLLVGNGMGEDLILDFETDGSKAMSGTRLDGEELPENDIWRNQLIIVAIVGSFLTCLGLVVLTWFAVQICKGGKTKRAATRDDIDRRDKRHGRNYNTRIHQWTRDLRP